MSITYASHSGCRTETLGATGLSGTSVSATTANVKADWTPIGGLTSFEYNQIVVTLMTRNVGTASQTNWIVDIGYGSSTATISSMIVQDLRLEGPLTTSNFYSQAYMVPVYVPAGMQVSARTACTSTPYAVDVLISGSSRGAIRGAPGYSRMFAISTATQCRGPTVLVTATDAPWFVMTNNCPRPSDALMMYVAENVDNAKTAAMNWLVDIGVGSSTDSIRVEIDDVLFSAETLSDVIFCKAVGWFPVSINQGDSVQVRANSTSTASADNALDVMLYGLEP